MYLNRHVFVMCKYHMKTNILRSKIFYSGLCMAKVFDNL